MKQCIHDIYKIIDRSYFNIKDKRYDFNLNKLNNYELPLRSVYIPEIIMKWINNNIKFNYNLIINIKNREVIINIYSDKYIDNINYYFFKIELILLILTNYSFKNCSKNIDIKIYLTPFKKIWSMNDPIDVLNVNTGYSTIGCINTSELLLFRQEEWYKVLIHELMHNLNLDFADIYREKYKLILKENFYINSKYDLTETYCEFWGRQLNLIIYTYLKINKKNIFEIFYKNYNFALKKELNFSLQQANKLSEIIYLSDYNEKTNVFCYYILTSVLMYYSEDFIKWCKENNNSFINFKKDNRNIINFIKFISNKYYSKDYILNLQKSITNDITMRMTIIS